MPSVGWYALDVLEHASGTLDDVVVALFPEPPSPWDEAPASIGVSVELASGGCPTLGEREPWRVVRLGSLGRAIDDQIDAVVDLPEGVAPPPRPLIALDGGLPLGLLPLGGPLPPAPREAASDLGEELFLALVSC